MFEIIKYKVKPTQFARIVLGNPDKKSGSTLFYYSPLRVKERTPSLAVNDKEGITDFGTGQNYDIISFVSEIEGRSPISACYRIAELVGITLPDTKKNKSHLEYIKNKIEEEIKIQEKINSWYEKTYIDLTNVYQEWHNLRCKLPKNNVTNLDSFIYKNEQYYESLVDMFFYADSEDKINLYKEKERFDVYERKRIVF